MPTATFLSCLFFLTTLALIILRATFSTEYTQLLQLLQSNGIPSSDIGTSGNGGSTSTSGSSSNNTSSFMSLLGSRRLSVFTLGGQRIDLLNLRLSLIDRNFDHRDYEALLALDTQSPETPQFGSHPPTPVPKRRIDALKIKRTTTSTSTSTTTTTTTNNNNSSSSNSIKKKGGSGIKGMHDYYCDDNKNNNNSNITTTATVSNCSCSQNDDDDDIVCSICLDNFEDGALVMQLPCGHEFHEWCAQDWFTRKGMGSTCPNCNREVFTQ